MPLETSLAIKLSIFDLISPGLEGGVPEPLEPLAPPPCSAELISFNAEDNALWSDELIARELTSDCSSAWSNCSGDW